jgi:hypothetical protein
MHKLAQIGKLHGQPSWYLFIVRGPRGAIAHKFVVSVLLSSFFVLC